MIALEAGRPARKPGTPEQSVALSTCSSTLLMGDLLAQAALPLPAPLCWAQGTCPFLPVYHEWHSQRPLIPQAVSASSQEAPGTPGIPCLVLWSLRQEVTWEDPKAKLALCLILCRCPSESLLELHLGREPGKLTIQASLIETPTPTLPHTHCKHSPVHTRVHAYTHTHKHTCTYTPDCQCNLALCLMYPVLREPQRVKSKAT